MISKFFIERPRFAIVISIVITIAGLIAMISLPVSQYPDITPSTVQISATYPGADADTLQKTVVEPIEAQVNGVKRMMYISSTSADNGQATINITFPAGTDGDINTVNVQNREKLAEAQLPQPVQSQGVSVKEKSTNMLMIFDLYSDDNRYDAIFLSNYINIYINDEIARIPGVGDTTIMGGANYSMRIWLDAEKMANLRIAPGDVQNAINAQNVQVSAGSLGEEPAPKGQVFRYTVQTQGRLETVEQFKSIVIRAMSDGSKVTIGDIARVELGAENYSQSSYIGGHKSAKLMIYQLPEGNGLQIASACNAKMKELSKAFPEGLKYTSMYDTTRFIKASIQEVVVTLFEAIALVILVTFIFLQDWRAALVPTIAIPVSLIGTFAFMLALGYSINLITLFGLILAIGIVVDDAIVVIENVNRLMEEEGLPPKEAAKKTMDQVTGPVIATTLVLLDMFIPVCFLPGITGSIYRQFGVTISISVLISSLNALTLSPALSAVLLKPKKAGHKPFILFRAFNWIFDGITNGYTAIVKRLVRIAILVVIAYSSLIFVGWKLYGMIPTGFIPSEDQGAFFVNVQLPDAASMQRTEAITAQISNTMKGIPGVIDVMTVNGYSILNSSSATNNAFLVGVLDDWSKRQEPSLKVDAVMAKLYGQLAAIPGALAFPFQMPAIPGIGQSGGFSFVIEDTTGLDPERIEKAANSFIAEANKRPEIGQAYTTFSAKTPRIFLKFDREKALKMGVSLNDINQALSSMQGYVYINDFNKFGKVFKVEMQAEARYRATIDSFNGIYVRNDQGDMVPVSTMVQIETKFGPQYINRYNLYTSVTVNGDPAPGYSSGQAMQALEEVAATTLPQGMKHEWTDMSYQEKLAGGQTAIVFGLALLFIYLFLVAQYESWMLPWAVMLSVPVAFVGALVATWTRHFDNNVYTQVGFVLLFGLACKTAILIVEFAHEQRKAGRDTLESAVFAARLRFRAVMMTAISFILGVMPLVFADGAGALSRKSLGTAICGGMLIAAIIGTILIPSFYVVVQKIMDFGEPKGKEEPKPAETKG